MQAILSDSIIDIIQNLLYMSSDRNITPIFYYPSLIIEKKSTSDGAHVLLAIHRFLSSSMKTPIIVKFMIDITHERYGQTVFSMKRTMRLVCILTHTDDLNTFGVKFYLPCRKIYRLSRTSWSIILGIEVEKRIRGLSQYCVKSDGL